MNRYFSISIFLLLFLFSCGDSSFDVKSKLLTDYSKNFIARYGDVAKQQDWCTTTIVGIDAIVGVDTPCDILVYSGNPLVSDGKCFLLGQFESVSDWSEFNIDVPYTLSTLFIAAQCEDYFVLKECKIKDDKISVSFEDEDKQQGKIPTAEPMSYIMAFEVGDDPTVIDYNDVILKVTHVSGQQQADISLLAVGAKKRMRVSYDGDVETVLFEDVLKAFSLFNLKHTVNVTAGKFKDTPPQEFKNLQVGRDFSISRDAYRFKLTVTDAKDKVSVLHAFADKEFFGGIPSNVITIAQPDWEWVYEGTDISEIYPSFIFWTKAYRLYNDWWDSIWDKRDLVNVNGSFQPTYDYKDLLFSSVAIAENGGHCPDISYTNLSKYSKSKFGIDLAFVITGREGREIKLTFSRSDGEQLQWFASKPEIRVYGDGVNVDYGGGNAETCHILLSQEDIANLVKNKASLSITFDRLDSNAKLNSIWAREHK